MKRLVCDINGHVELLHHCRRANGLAEIDKPIDQRRERFERNETLSDGSVNSKLLTRDDVVPHGRHIGVPNTCSSSKMLKFVREHRAPLVLSEMLVEEDPHGRAAAYEHAAANLVREFDAPHLDVREPADLRPWRPSHSVDGTEGQGQCRFTSSTVALRRR